MRFFGDCHAAGKGKERRETSTSREGSAGLARVPSGQRRGVWRGPETPGAWEGCADGCADAAKGDGNI